MLSHVIFPWLPIEIRLYLSTGKHDLHRAYAGQAPCGCGLLGRPHSRKLWEPGGAAGDARCWGSGLEVLPLSVRRGTLTSLVHPEQAQGACRVAVLSFDSCQQLLADSQHVY